MMSAILRLDSLMPRMVSTTSETTSPPCTATVLAFMASWLAWRALSAFWRTVAPSCSMEAAVSSRALAWLSVRPDRSWLPCEISALADATLSALARTPATTRARLPCMWPSAFSSAAASSRPWAWMDWVRSPSAIKPAPRTANCKGPVTERLNKIAAPAPTSSATAVTTIRMARLSVACLAALSRVLSYSARWRCSMATMDCR